MSEVKCHALFNVQLRCRYVQGISILNQDTMSHFKHHLYKIKLEPITQILLVLMNFKFMNNIITSLNNEKK